MILKYRNWGGGIAYCDMMYSLQYRIAAYSATHTVGLQEAAPP